MNAGTASLRSILDKPLNQLTEDDISQLTREDCRRFLKEKGMRRPSWNKSQALQQVISLKALLEPADEGFGAGPVRKLAFVSAAEDNPTRNLDVNVAAANALGVYAPGTGTAEEPGLLHAGEELQKSGSYGEKPSGAEANEKVVTPRGCATTGSVEQMTIFYCGKVNVYDGVPPDKARVIMQLAASPVHLPPDDPFNRNTAVWPSLCHLLIDKDAHIPIDSMVPHVAQADKMLEYPMQYREKGSTVHDGVEGQASRKVSLQQCFEQRTDRSKSKKITGITSSSLEMCMNHQVKDVASNRNSSHSSTSSPPQPKLPQIYGGSTENQSRIAFPVDLNDKDVQEC